MQARKLSITATVLATGFFVSNVLSSDDQGSRKKIKVDDSKVLNFKLPVQSIPQKEVILSDLVKNWEAKVVDQNGLYTIPYEVFLYHILKSDILSTKDILNFGETCRSHYSLIQNIPIVTLEKIKFKAIDEIEKKIQSSSILMNLPASLELHKYYNQLFNDAMIKYKDKEKAKILAKKLSPEKENLELRGLVVRMLFINYGYHDSIANNYHIPAQFSLHGRSIFRTSQDAFGAILDLDFEEMEDFNVKSIVMDEVDTYTLSLQMNSSGEYTSERIINHFVGKRSIYSSPLFTQISHINDESEIMAKQIIQYYLRRMANVIAHNNITSQADSFIKNLGERIEAIYHNQPEDFTEDFPFYNKETFEQFLMSKRSFKHALSLARKIDAAYLIESQLEILKSIFDN